MRPSTAHRHLLTPPFAVSDRRRRAAAGSSVISNELGWSGALNPGSGGAHERQEHDAPGRHGSGAPKAALSSDLVEDEGGPAVRGGAAAFRSGSGPCNVAIPSYSMRWSERELDRERERDCGSFRACDARTARERAGPRGLVPLQVALALPPSCTFPSHARTLCQGASDLAKHPHSGREQPLTPTLARPRGIWRAQAAAALPTRSFANRTFTSYSAILVRPSHHSSQPRGEVAEPGGRLASSSSPADGLPPSSTSSLRS